MKKTIVAILLSFLLAALITVDGLSASEELANLYTQGNSEYQKGNYAAAEQYYRRILIAGVDSAAVYYNLGNAYFKMKKLGEAIYYWEKAQQRAPADRDIRENMQLASLMLVDRVETQSDPLPMRVLSAVQGLLSIRQEVWLVFALFVIANFFFTIYLTTRSRNSVRALIASLAAGLLFVLFACSLSWKIYDRDYRKKAVVIEQKVDVRSGPGLENITVFTIHEGIKVRVLGSTNGWLQISLPNGWNGWLPQNNIRIL